MKKILIVEDDVAIAGMMETLLKLEGYAVITARDGEEGVQALQRNPDVGVVLLDMMMPQYNGWHFLDYLRSTQGSLPVIVVSAYREIARSVKPTAFVPKPVQLENLLGAIEKLVA